MHSLWVVFPLLLFLLSAILCLLCWRNIYYQRSIFLLGSTAAFGISVWLILQVAEHGVLVLQAGNWKAPYGISIVVDIFSALMLGITTLLGVAIFFYTYAQDNINEKQKSFGFYPVLLFMLAGITGAFITGDIFNLYVWFEVMLVSSFVLITLGSHRQQLEGGIKYVTINFIASSFLLLAIGILYGIAGTTNLADLSVRLQNPDISGLARVASMLLLVSFGIKAAIFPLFFWLPASYHTPPVAIGAVIAGLLTKVGVYALIRTFTLLFPLEEGLVQLLLLVLAGCTMISGVFGAIAHYDLRKILAFHIISQIGYMIMGLAIFTPLALTGAIFYIIHHILVKTNLFFISGVVARYGGSFKLKKLGGIYEHLPLAALLFAISAFSLAGFPPLSGFWGKFILAKAGLQAQQYLLVAVSLLTGLLTIFSMIKIWRMAFLPAWPDAPDMPSPMPQKVFVRKHKGMLSTVILLSSFTLAISFYPAPLLDLSQKAADQLLNRTIYVNAVLTMDEDE